MGVGRRCCRSGPYVPVTQRTHTSARFYTRTFARAVRSGCRADRSGCTGRSFRLPGRSFRLHGPIVAAAGPFVPGCRAVRSGCRAVRSGCRAVRSGRRVRGTGPAGPIVRQLRSGCRIRTIGGERAPTVADCTGATVSARAALASQSRAIYGPVRRGGCWPLGPVRVTFGHTPKSVPADAGRTCHTFSDEFRRPNGHPNPRHGALTRRH
jgi:hypothetical protein